MCRIRCLEHLHRRACDLGSDAVTGQYEYSQRFRIFAVQWVAPLSSGNAPNAIAASVSTRQISTAHLRVNR